LESFDDFSDSSLISSDVSPDSFSEGSKSECEEYAESFSKVSRSDLSSRTSGSFDFLPSIFSAIEVFLWLPTYQKR
jgi:hypothetical protein